MTAAAKTFKAVEKSDDDGWAMVFSDESEGLLEGAK